MARDVFISHSAHDKAVADAICAALEEAAIRCWVASCGSFIRRRGRARGRESFKVIHPHPLSRTPDGSYEDVAPPFLSRWRNDVAHFSCPVGSPQSG